MAVTGTGQLGDARLEVLAAEFDFIVPRNYVYAQAPITYVPSGGVLREGAGYSSLRIPSYHRLLPANSTRSEVTDISPVQLVDSQVTVSPSLYGNAVQLGLKVQKESANEVFQIASRLIAENAAESVDYVARTAAIGGRGFEIANGTARSAVNSPLTPGMLYNAAGYLASAPKLDGGLNAPTIGAGLAAVMRNAVVADLAENSSIILLGQYRDSAPETVLMGEIGQHMSGIRLIVSDYAKIFHGGGTTQAPSSDNLANAVSAGATTAEVSTAITSAANGAYFTVGVRETTVNGEQTNVETIWSVGGATTMVISGGAPNGGFVYDHSSDTVIGGYFQVHGVVVFGAKALMKVHDAEIGANPQLLPPKVDGLLDQWDSAQWRWFGGFARRAENGLYRLEVASNRQVLGI